MYFTVFSSSQYYSDDDIDDKLIIDETDMCVICWMPSTKYNKINILSDFSHITTKCNCKPKIHYLCLNNWINRTSSCPICRTPIINHLIYSFKQNTFIEYYITISSQYSLYFLTIICYTSFINLICVLLYNMYITYYFTKNYHYENYGI